VREVFGGSIDCDPATSETAQRSVNATRYYTAAADSLKHPWSGNVWLNPPYDRELVVRFVAKLLAEIDAGRCAAAIVLVNAQVSADWFQRLFAAADAVCYPNRRIRFLDAAGNPGSPKVGQRFLYFGPDPARFQAVFSPLGHVTGTKLLVA
jgi:hypothetical protein